MEPTTEEPATATSGWAGPTYAPQIPSATVKRGRPWLVAIVSTLALLVVIVVIGNQWVTNKIAEHLAGSTFFDRFVSGLTTYAWRFSPRGGHDIDRLWLGSVCLVVAVLALTFLLVAVICRGNGSFGQAFFGAWAVVVVATLLAVYVRAAVADTRGLFGPNVGSKTDAIFYSPLSPNSTQVLAALCVGFVVGLVAGLTAVLSRSTEVVAPAVPPGYGAPAFGGPSNPANPYNPYGAPVVPGPIASPSPWGGPDDDRSGQAQHTVTMPVVDDPNQGPSPDANNQATTQLPHADWQRSAADPSSDSSSDDHHTTELPRSTSPDDEGPRHLNE